MPIDTSIYSNLLRPPKSVADYDAENQSYQQNALALQTARQGQSDDNALRQATMRFGADPTANRSLIAQTGNYKALSAFDKAQLDAQKAKGEMAKDAAQTGLYGQQATASQLEQKIKAHDFHMQQLGGITDVSQVPGWVAQGVKDGVMDFDRSAQGLQLFLQDAQQNGLDAAKQKAMQGGLSAKDQLAQQLQSRVQAETARHNTSTEALTGRGQDMSAATAAQGQAITMRGQNMVDARSRETQAAANQAVTYQTNPDTGEVVALPSKLAPGSPVTARSVTLDGMPLKGKGATNSKVGDAKDVLSLLDQAEPLIGQATNSFIGQGRDLAARSVGISTQGAQAAAQLKALEGALIAKMPKMSGPQSDKDVLLYRQMAGQIGDETVPAGTKRAAMKTIRAINERNAGATPSVNAAHPPDIADLLTKYGAK